MKKIMYYPMVLTFIITAGISFILVLATCGGDGGGGGGGGGEAPRSVTLETDKSIDWVAFQNGTGSEWVKGTPDSTDNDTGVSTFTFDVDDPDKKYSIAFHRYHDGEGHSVTVIRATTAEISKLVEVEGSELKKPYTVSGTMTLEPSGDWANVSFGSETLYDASSPYEIFGPTGLSDLFAQQFEIVNSVGFQNKFLITRDIDLSIANVTGQDIDFTSGVSASSYNLTILNSPDAILDDMWVNLFTKNGTKALVNQGGTYFDPATGIDMFYLPQSGLISGDLLEFDVEMFNPSAGTQKSQIRTVSAPSAGNLTVDLRDSAIAPYTTSAVVNTTSVTGLSYTPSASSPQLRGYATVMAQDNAEWIVIMTPAWLGGSTQAAMPAITNVPGYHPSWLLNFESTNTGLAGFMRSDVDFERHAGLIEQISAKFFAPFTPTVDEDNSMLSGDYVTGVMEVNITNSAANSLYVGAFFNGTGEYDLDFDFNGTPDDSGVYTSYVDGTMVFNNEAQGIVNSTGDVFVLADSNFYTPDENGAFAIGIRNGTGLSNSVMSGEYLSYQFESTPLGESMTKLVAVNAPGASGEGWIDFWIQGDSHVPGNVGTTGSREFSVAPSGILTLPAVSPSIVNDVGMIRSDGKLWFAVNPPDGGDDTAALIIGMKKSTGLTNSILSGTYTLLQVGGFNNTTGTTSAETSLVTVVADGNGSLNFSIDAHTEGGAVGIYGTFPYSVNDDGTFAVTTDEGDLQGMVMDDGSMFTLVDLNTELSGGNTGDFDTELAVGIRKTQ